jgi:hypothetical protein
MPQQESRPRDAKIWLGMLLVAAAVAAGGFAMTYPQVRTAAPVPDDLCAAIRAQVVEELVPEAEVAEDDSTQSSQKNSAECRIATGDGAEEDSATAEVVVELERFRNGSDAEHAFDTAQSRSYDEHDERQDVPELGERAFLREYSRGILPYADWYPGVEVGVLDSATVLVVRYEASPADPGMTAQAAAALAEEVLAAL